MTVAVIDLGISNIESVVHALRRIGVVAQRAGTPGELASVRAIVLPGVGAFAAGMDELDRRGLGPALADAVSSGVPVLGICLGLQLLADSGEEGGARRGLGLIPGRVARLLPNARDRVPHIGWSDVEAQDGSRLFSGNPIDGNTFYFVHGYYLECEEPSSVAATFEFGGCKLTAAVERGNLFGVQFHPEKSHEAGLAILDRFCAFARDARG